MGLRKYILKRIIISIAILWLVATLNFIIFSLQKGDPYGFLLEKTDIEQKTLEKLRQAHGYYDPLYVKYLKYLKNMFSFGIVYPYFGWSIQRKAYIAPELAWRLGITVCLLGSAMIGRILIGIPLGILAAAKRGGKLDVSVVGFSLFTWGVPSFFLQLLAIMFFGDILRDTYGIRIFSTTWSSPKIREVNLDWWASAIAQLTLPILTLVAIGFGSWLLYTRNLLVDALTSDYVTTARAKGLSERTVLYRHAFKSILPPISTMIALAIPPIIAGAVITEQIYGIEGMGRWYIAAISQFQADYGVAQAIFFLFATLVIACNFLADILYGVLDPRIRVGTRR